MSRSTPSVGRSPDGGRSDSLPLADGPGRRAVHGDLAVRRCRPRPGPVRRLRPVRAHGSAALVGKLGVRQLRGPHPDRLRDRLLGANLPRLSETKELYDPDDVFSFPQSVPLPSEVEVPGAAPEPSPARGRRATTVDGEGVDRRQLCRGGRLEEVPGPAQLLLGHRVRRRIGGRAPSLQT